MNYKVTDYIPRRKDLFIDLSVDNINLPPIPAVADAIRAAAWESDGHYNLNHEGNTAGFGFFCEDVAKSLEKECKVSNSSSFPIHPHDIYINNGDRTAFPNLFGALPRDLKIAVALPAPKKTLGAVKEYFKRASFFTPSDLGLPTPRDLIKNDTLPKNLPEAVYLHLPCEPSGVTFRHSELCEWVSFANKHGILLIFDSSNSAYCRENAPRSVFCVDGAELCAAQLHSFSTPTVGVACGYSVIHEKVRLRGESLAKNYAAHKRCHVPYIIQRAAVAVLDGEGQRMCAKRVELFRRSAQRLSAALSGIGFEVFRCGSSPYVLAALPPEMHFECDIDACQYIEYRTGVRATPGTCYGIESGRHMCFSCINSSANIDEAAVRLGDI